jgi:plasmid stabilization system protein ParE
MTVRFLAPARLELREAIAYYNHKQSQLGSRFSEAVKRAASSIVQYPLAWPSASEVTRHCQVRGFPYSLIYYLESNEVVIVAVMHHRQAPQHWRERLT